MSLPEATSQSLAVLIAPAVRIRAPSGLNARAVTTLMGKGGDELARGRIPEFGGFVCARRQNFEPVRTKRPLPDPTRIVKGGDELPESASQSLALCPSSPLGSEHHRD